MLLNVVYFERLCVQLCLYRLSACVQTEADKLPYNDWNFHKYLTNLSQVQQMRPLYIKLLFSHCTFDYKLQYVI